MILCHSGLPLHSLCSLASGAFTSVLGEGRTSFWDFLLARCRLTPGAAGTVRSLEHPLHGQLRGGEVHLNYLWHDCFIAKLVKNTLNVSQLTAPLLKQNCRADGVLYFLSWVSQDAESEEHLQQSCSFYPEMCSPTSEMLMPSSYQEQRSHL